MNSFPITELYKKIAKIQLLRDDTNSIIGTGTGFFYWNYNDGVYFATKRDSIIIEEQGFLPDSIVLHPNIEAKIFGNGNGITLSLYDEHEKPTWRMLPSKSNEAFVSIPVSDKVEFEFNEYFTATNSLPSEVYIPLGEVSLEFQIPVMISLADYFFYSDVKSEKIIHKHVEDQVGFKLHRKGFSKDMLEMVLVLINYNMDDLGKSSKNYERYLKIHQGLVLELDKIIRQFSDVLASSILERIKNIFELLSQRNFLEDNLIIRFLINRVLQQLGKNIFFVA